MSVDEVKKGKWHYLFMLNGERKHGLCHGCRTQKEAQEYENDLKYTLSLQQRGKIDYTQKITFKKMMDAYLTYSLANKANYKKDLHYTHVLTEFFGANKNIMEIKPTDIEGLKTFLTVDKKLSNATFNRYFSALSKAYNVIIKDNNPNILNPCRNVKKLKEDNQKTRYLSKDEEKALFKELAGHLVPITIIALQTGLRKGNILTMRWENVDFEHGFIEVLKQENKGHKKIQMLISKKLLAELKKLNPQKEGFIFINPKTGNPYKDIHNGFDKAVERAGITDFTFHDLRHTVATRLVTNGADIKTVQEFLSHSQISTTQRYAHATSDSKQKAVDILNSY